MSLKKNFLYSSILTSAGYIFPLITYPYVSRVLGVNNIGICNFVDSVINYYLLFAMMGIRTIGIREIARCQGNREELSRVFFSILLLNSIFVFICGSILILSVHFVPQFAEYKELMYIGAVKLFATFLMIEWLFKGVEDFKYITHRSILVRTLYVIAVFIFVRKQEDYPIYFLLAALTEGINAIVNCIYARKYISFKILGLNPFSYIKSSLTLGCYSLLTTMYTTFNVVYLGFVSTTAQVGYYTTATKLHHIILAFFTAFTGVMMPRMSNLLSLGKYKEFEKKINDSISVLIHFSIPVVIIGMCFAPEIIGIISGPGYEGATYPFMIVMPLVFVIGIEQILVMQTLMPLKRDKAILINSVIGAIVGIGLNILLVNQFGSLGSSIVWFFSELGVMLSALYFSKKEISLYELKSIPKNLCFCIPPVIVCQIIKLLNLHFFIALILATFLVCLYYMYLYVYVVKDKIIISIIPQSVLRKIL